MALVLLRVRRVMAPFWFILRRASYAGSMVMIALALGAVAVFAAVPRVPKAENPHWKADGCDKCHTMAEGKPAAISVEKADEVCLNCHDGRRASEEFHPVGRTFDHDKYDRPKTWPLAGDRLACLTCHEMKPACDAKAQRLVSNRMLLRDYQVGRQQSQPFCRNCHHDAGYKKLNPHEMLLEDKDEIIEDKCLFCHNKPLDRKSLVRTGEQSLKADQDALCKDCHPQHKDPMQQGHINLPIREEMLARMYAREVLGLSAELNVAMIEQLRKSGKQPTLLVPDKTGKIACSTCHNPHQSGVFPRDSVLAYRAMKLGGRGHLTSPVRGKTWCRHCHDM